MDHAVNVVSESPLSNSDQSPTLPSASCDHCGRQNTRWRPERPPIVYEPPNLRAVAIEKVKQLVVMSRLPQSEFATYVLGANAVTVTRYLKGERIPQDRLTQLHAIQCLERDGRYITTVTQTCAARKHWHTMERKRELGLAPWLAAGRGNRSK